MKLNRFYPKNLSSKSMAEIDVDFHHLEELYENLQSDIKNHQFEIIHTPIQEAFRIRLKIIIYQNQFRAYHLLRGIINELNNNNLPTTIPLVRTFLELTVQLGYLCIEIEKTDDYEHLMNDPMYKIYLGNKNDGAGDLSIGKVETVHILDMVRSVDKYLNRIGENKKEETIMNFYSDLSNQSHPNYGSNMFYSTIDEDGIFRTLEDIDEDMESVKALAYYFYMPHLFCTIGLYNLFLGKIQEDSKVNQFS